MAFSPFRAIGQGITWFWSAVDSSRRFLINFIFLLLVIFLLSAIFSSDKDKLLNNMLVVPAMLFWRKYRVRINVQHNCVTS